MLIFFYLYRVDVLVNIIVTIIIPHQRFIIIIIVCVCVCVCVRPII